MYSPLHPLSILLFCQLVIYLFFFTFLLFFSDSIQDYIGFEGHTIHSTCNYSKLSYHCLQFGSHVRWDVKLMKTISFDCLHIIKEWPWVQSLQFLARLGLPPCRTLDYQSHFSLGTKGLNKNKNNNIKWLSHGLDLEKNTFYISIGNWFLWLSVLNSSD